MALIICPECGGKISDKAETCIHCGYPLRGKGDVGLEDVVSICKHCNGKISFQEDVCHSCGVQIEKDWYEERNLCKINGREYNLTPYIIALCKKDLTWQESAQISKSLQELTGCADCSKLCHKIKRGESLPRVFNGMTIEEVAKQVGEWKSRQVHCKYCNSTNVKKLPFVGVGNRVSYAGMQWHCNNCGSNF